MPVFQYTELDQSGRISSGNMVAADKMEVIQNIKNKDNKVIKIVQQQEQSKDIKSIRLFQKKVTSKDLYIFCKQIHTMLDAGMPLINAITVLENQTENPTLKKIFLEVQIDLQKGLILSQAMRKHKQFPPLLVNMVQAGEMTGNLDDVMAKMAIHYEKENKINARIRSAMIYPIVLGILAISVIIFILVALMPMFVNMFQEAGVELPLPTRILIGMSNFMVHYWYIVIVVVVLAIIFFKRILSTPEGQRIWNKFLLRLPGVKKPLQMIYTSRFTRTLSTLLGSGISIIAAMESAAKVTDNRLVIDGIEDATESIKKGALVSTTLQRLKLFPSMMISMIGIGEESGSIEDMLAKTADYYDQELDEAITKLVALMEPALIIVMGFAVGMSVISILLPMFDMATTVK